MDELAAKERDKYQKMWAVDRYRRTSPGEQSLDRALDWLDAKPHADYVSRFYDFGSGPGRASLKLYQKGFDVQMLDITSDALDKEVADALNPHLCFNEVCLWDDLEGMTKRDYGLCCDVMEHIPTEKVEAVLQNIAALTFKTFFSIAMCPDQFGKVIGQPLHLTVKDPHWWLDHLYAFWSDVRASPCGNVLYACCQGRRGHSFNIQHLDEIKGHDAIRPFELGDKRIAVLCPGPSLKETWGNDHHKYDYVVGVNRAATRFQCTHWAALDTRMREIEQPLGSPDVIGTKGECRNSIAKRFGFSTLVAIAYAANMLGARHIDIYGHDMGGLSDFDGHTDPRNNRTDRRWRKEKMGYDALVQHFEEKGVTINRVLPQAVCGES